MNAFRASVGRWTAAVRLGSVGCAYDALGTRALSLEADRQFVALTTMTVELRELRGGIAPWAMLGGTYYPRAGHSLEVSIPYEGSLIGHSGAPCTGLLGRPLVRGLPVDFVDGVADGLEHYEVDVGAGLLVVSDAAYDPVDSSPRAFRNAAALLVWAIFTSGNVDEAALESLLKGWVSGPHMTSEVLPAE